MSHDHDKEHHCAICDGIAEGKTREEVFAKILADMTQQIADKGVVVHAIDGMGDQPSFAYTTGLTEMGLPEVFMIGLPVQYAANGVGGYYHQIKDGTLKSEVTTIESLFNLPIEKVDVVANDAYAGLSDLCKFTTDYYQQRGITVKWQQLVMCDPAGLMPWDMGFDHDLMDNSQPIFGVPESIREIFGELADPDHTETATTRTLH